MAFLGFKSKVEKVKSQNKDIYQLSEEAKPMLSKIFTITFICILVILGGYSINKQAEDKDLNNTISSIENDDKSTTFDSLNPSTSVSEEVSKAKAPYVGMRESAIQTTLLGKATNIEKCLDFDHLDNRHKWKKYTWDYGGGKKLVAKIYYDAGYGEVVSIDKYPKDPYGNTMPGYWD